VVSFVIASALDQRTTSVHLLDTICVTLVAFAVFSVSPAQASAPLNYLVSRGGKADAVVGLTWGVLIVSLAVIAIISLLLAGAIWHRPGAAAQSPGARLPLERPSGGLKWIWIGVGVSSVVLLLSVVWTMAVLAQIARPSSKPALTIEITGRQWWWQVRYLSDDPSRVFATANEIHIPTGVPVKFRLIGGDVIHSFWVPALSGKTDLIPGQTNETWLEAHNPGVYRGQCTEYCGVEHAHMGLLLIAQTPADFRAWYARQLQLPGVPSNGQIAAGVLNFNAHCGSCHAIRGTAAAGVLGPDLSHWNTHKTIAGALPNDPVNLARWISDPQAVKPGALMQKPELSANELADIQAYLKTLN